MRGLIFGAKIRKWNVGTARTAGNVINIHTIPAIFYIPYITYIYAMTLDPMLPEPDEAKQAKKEKKQKEAELKDIRNFLAFDRTLLAWVRTSTSLLTFGFAIAKLLQQEVAGPGEHPVLKAINPVNVGMTMIFFGFFGQTMAVYNYVLYARKFGKSNREILTNPAMLVSYVVILLSFSIVFSYTLRSLLS